MIVAALVLIAIGLADVIREVAVPGHDVAHRPRTASALRRSNLVRRIGFAVAALAIILLGVAAGAWPVGPVAIACAAAWVWLMPAHAPARAGLWPAIGLAILTGGSVALLGARGDIDAARATTDAWSMPTPWGSLSLDAALLVIGALLFLLESSNLVVRAALRSATPVDASGSSTSHPPAAPEPAASATLKGGRLIGPLERLLVFALTLAGMYTLLAAVLAAKGIVRFPEISRDRDAGNRAEYFLVGSLVSWVVALGAALLVWWAVTTPAG